MTSVLSLAVNQITFLTLKMNYRLISVVINLPYNGVNKMRSCGIGYRVYQID